MRGVYGYSRYGSVFGSGSSLSSIYSNLAQYSSVRTGAYAKATKAYYAKVVNSDANKTQQTAKGRRKETVDTVLSSAKSSATKLLDSAKKLTAIGKGSLFSGKDGFDRDEAYKAVSEFVNNYNDTLSAVNGTDNVSVKNAAGSMTRMSGIMKNSLSKVGVNVGTDGRLTIDQETFKNADESKIKSLFNGNGSYASVVENSANRIASQAGNSLAGNSLYGATGSYYNNFTNGLLYNGYF